MTMKPKREAEPSRKTGAEHLPWNTRKVKRDVNGLPYRPNAMKMGFNDKQFTSARIELRKDGRFNARVWFSQGKKWDGDNFAAVISLLDGSGKRLAESTFWSGINGRGWGGTKVVMHTKERKLPPETIKKVKSVVYRFELVNTKDDKAIWEVVRKLVDAIIAENGAADDHISDN